MKIEYYVAKGKPVEEAVALSFPLSQDQIRAFFGADSLQYLSYEGLIKATGLPESTFCTACYTGEYPIDIGENAQQINLNV